MTMATRFELISALYDDVSKDVIRSPNNWQEFLKSSCNNYGLPFSEQLLVYAQKPDAVAVLPMASWNRKFGRWVNKGAKGIALFDVSNKNYPRLKYVFDVSDTHEGEHAKEVPIWHMKDDYTNNVIKTLENVFGAVDNQSDLGSAVISACEKATVYPIIFLNFAVQSMTAFLKISPMILFHQNFVNWFQTAFRIRFSQDLVLMPI